MRPRALDLCCRAGGASVGLHRAGFDVVGCDVIYSKNYPFPLIVHDALDIDSVLDLDDFQFIWASPPCQPFSKGLGNQKTSEPDIIEPMRQLLSRSAEKWCMENVECAPIRPDVILTGDMFGLNTYRKRHFELAGFWCVPPFTPGPKFGPQTRPGSVTVAGGGGKRAGDLSAWSDAMEIDWMTRAEIVEAVPPSYAEYIARQAILGLRNQFDISPREFLPARISASWDGSLSQAKIGRLKNGEVNMGGDGGQ